MTESRSGTILNQLAALSRPARLIVPWLAPLLFVVLEIQHHAPNFAISNLDYFPLVERALRLSFSSAADWVNWQHPVGYSWLIRFGLEAGFDAVRFGQALSIVGGVLGLFGAYALGWAVSGSRAVALVCQWFTAFSSTYLLYGGREGNDMLPAGLQIAALGAMVAGLVTAGGNASCRDQIDVPLARWIILAAVATGLAYLTRYTGLITAAACASILLAIALFRRSRPAWKALGLYLLVFVVTTAVQWIPSLIITGSPLNTDQGQNVWFHVYGKSDFLTEWNIAPQNITVLQVFQLNPGKFIRYWWNTFQSFWLSPQLTLVSDPLKLFGLAGLVFMLLAGGAIRWSARLLIGLFVVLHLAALSLMRLDPRFLIMLAPLLTVGAVYLFWRMLPSRWQVGRVAVPVQALAVVAGLLLALPLPSEYAAKPATVTPNLIEASDVLQAAGLRHASEVLSTHLQLQDLSAPDRGRFAQAFYQTLPHTSPQTLIDAARQQSFRFLIYDRASGPKIYPELAELLEPETHPAGQTPIYLESDRQFVIYRLENASPAVSPIAAFEHDLTLLEAEVHASQPVTGTARDRDVGVYLRWQTDRAQSASYKVFVHIVAEAGQLIAQDDSIPAQWLYPTTEWQPGQPVGDFHFVRLRDVEVGKPYTVIVGLYDENTGQRLQRLDGRGQTIDDKVVLPQAAY